MKRPSRGERLSATTMSYIAAFLRPRRARRILTAINLVGCATQLVRLVNSQKFGSAKVQEKLGVRKCCAKIFICRRLVSRREHYRRGLFSVLCKGRRPPPSG